MNNIIIDKKLALEYIRDTLRASKKKLEFVKHAKYHHNTRYRNAVSVCRNGILTMLDLHKYKIVSFSPEMLKKFEDDDFHVNGINAVSLSIYGMDDLHGDEEEYNPFEPDKVDFLVSSEVMASRNSTNYGNEFLSMGSISIDKIKAIDIRLIDLMNKIGENSYYTTEGMVNKYNALRDIACTIKEYNLDIPLREMSYGEEYSIDIDTLARRPRLKIK